MKKCICRSQNLCGYLWMQSSCIIEPSFCNATSGMHRCLIEGHHLVKLDIPVNCDELFSFLFEKIGSVVVSLF